MSSHHDRKQVESWVDEMKAGGGRPALLVGVDDNGRIILCGSQFLTKAHFRDLLAQVKQSGELIEAGLADAPPKPTVEAMKATPEELYAAVFRVLRTVQQRQPIGHDLMVELRSLVRRTHPEAYRDILRRWPDAGGPKSDDSEMPKTGDQAV